ncbi:hypothetical protein D3C72_1632420 [compost metagenome]
MINTSRRTDDDVFARVGFLIVVHDLSLSHLSDRRWSSQNRPSQRMLVINFVEENIVDDVFVVVLGHRDLLKDHALLKIEFFFSQMHVADDIS